jgi:hypothetical protein
MTPSLQRRVQYSMPHLRDAGTLCPPASRRRGWSFYGARRAEPVATARKWDEPKTAQMGRSATGGNPRQPLRSDGKEGVDGSSPSEGSAKTPHAGALCQVDLVLVDRGVPAHRLTGWLLSRREPDFAAADKTQLRSRCSAATARTAAPRTPAGLRESSRRSGRAPCSSR